MYSSSDSHIHFCIIELYMVMVYMDQYLLSWEIVQSYNICKLLAFVGKKVFKLLL